MGLVNLGDIVLDGFEVPARVEFGGKQRVVVHTLIGGTRVVDVLGRDDAALQWRGVLSGSTGANRARILDQMRVAGDTILLTWDAFCYSVIISELRLDFCSPWWIPYAITCVVQQDLAQASPVYTPDAVDSVVGDLTIANQLLGSAGTLNIGSVSTLLSSGDAGQQQVRALIGSLQTNVTQGLAASEAGMTSSDVGQLVTSAGLMAQYSCAQGYLGRSESNIANIGE